MISRKKKFLVSNPPITVSLDGFVSCRLYEDTRPHCLEIAKLQKGLVLLVNGKEVVEEGAGFGTPVALYEDRPYFSSSAEVTVEKLEDRKVLTKSFRMDTVSRKRFGKRFYLHDGVYIFLHKSFHRVYTRKGKLTPLLTKVIELRKALRIKTEFQQTEPKGTITVKYTCLPSAIEVEVQLSQLDHRGCKEILILNEQGTSFFRKYSDSNGLKLVDEQIGPWEKVNAEEASLSNMSETLAFSLKKTDGAVLQRGREKVQKRFSWVGFSYSLRPNTSAFRYVIELRVAGVKKRAGPILGDEVPVQEINP
jgi:hypothetical protein